ncbi:MAG: type II/IV secretion system protein, partial [Patescibacteria group bacterium]
ATLKKPKLKFVRAKGCVACGETGYKGRIGVFEIFVVEGRMEQLVLAGADGQQIREEALKQGMTTIGQDGYLKVIDKVTAVEEVERISEE